MSASGSENRVTSYTASVRTGGNEGGLCPGLQERSPVDFNPKLQHQNPINTEAVSGSVQLQPITQRLPGGNDLVADHLQCEEEKDEQTSVTSRTMPYMNTVPAPLTREFAEECTECGSGDIVESWNDGQILCRGCGIVLTEKLLDYAPEIRSFDDDTDDPNRCGPAANPLMEHEDGTAIASGTGNDRALAASLRRAQNNAACDGDIIMKAAIEQIDDCCRRMILPKNVSIRSKEIFKMHQDNVAITKTGWKNKATIDIKTKRTRDSVLREVIAATIFMASRNEMLPRTFREVSETTGVEQKKIGDGVRDIEHYIPSLKATHERSAGNFIDRFCIALELPHEIIEFSNSLAKAMQDVNSLSSRQDRTVAATAIFILCQLCEKDQRKRISAKAVAEVARLAAPTIKKTTAIAKPYLSKILPKDFNPAWSLEDFVKSK